MTNSKKIIITVLIAVVVVVAVLLIVKFAVTKNAKTALVNVVRLYNCIIDMADKNKIEYLSGDKISEEDKNLTKSLSTIEKWWANVLGVKISTSTMNIETRCKQLIDSWQKMYDYHHNDGKSILDFLKENKDEPKETENNGKSEKKKSTQKPKNTSNPQNTSEPKSSKIPSVTNSPSPSKTPSVTNSIEPIETPSPTVNNSEPTPPIPDKPVDGCDDGDGEDVPDNTEPPFVEATPGNTEPPFVEATPGNTEPPAH